MDFTALEWKETLKTTPVTEKDKEFWHVEVISELKRKEIQLSYNRNNKEMSWFRKLNT